MIFLKNIIEKLKGKKFMDATMVTPTTITKKRTRYYGIDFLRIVCMIMIPILHILGHGGILNGTAPLSVDFFTYWSLEILCYGAVNMFGIISGYVGVDTKFKLSNLAIIIIRALFYSLLITSIFYIAQLETFSAGGLAKAFFPTATEQWWYLTAYAAMFFFTPFINLAFQKIDLKKMVIFNILLFFVFATYICLANNGNDPRLLNGGYSPFWLLILYCFGASSKKLADANFNFFKKNYLNLLTGLLLVVLTIGSMIAIAYATGGTMEGEFNYQYLVSYVSPLVVGSSVLFVIFMRNLNIKRKASIKIIEFFTPLCLSVYLIHDHNFMRKHIIKGRFAFLLDYNPALSILIVIGSAIAIFLSCCIVDFIREFVFRKLSLKKHLDNLENKIKNKILNFVDRKFVKNNIQ